MKFFDLFSRKQRQQRAKAEANAKIARRKQRQRERRARRQTDQQRTAFVSAVGPDEASVWCDGTAGWRRPRNGPHSDGESQ